MDGPKQSGPRLVVEADDDRSGRKIILEPARRLAPEKKEGVFLLPPFHKSRNALPQSTVTRSLGSLLRMTTRRRGGICRKPTSPIKRSYLFLNRGSTKRRRPEPYRGSYHSCSFNISVEKRTTNAQNVCFKTKKYTG